MTSPVTFEATALDGTARAGTLTTPHGPVATPAFMPVGTRATVKTLDVRDLDAAGAEMVLANTYHLMLRPGSDVVASLGGLHGFMAWDGPLLTDSGGFQVWSLDPGVDEDGVRFRSTYDGAAVTLTPERSMEVQQELGADIAMAFDELVGLPADREIVRAAMDRTLRWAERCLAAHRRPDQALFGIVQGGVDPELRAESAVATAQLGFPGFGIGGLSVGESADQRAIALESAIAELPIDRVRYVMGLGDTEGVLAAIARGADLFDCVWPTRLARHGKVLSRSGDFQIKRAEYMRRSDPIDPACRCFTCSHHSLGYLRHLRVTGELLGQRLLSIHNLTYTLDVLAGARDAIAAGRFQEYRDATVAGRTSGNGEAALR